MLNRNSAVPDHAAATASAAVPDMQLRPPMRQCPTTRPLSRITSLLTFLTKEKLRRRQSKSK